MNFKNLIYTLTCVVFITILGAGAYEHIAVWPNAFAAPPQSLSMFQGHYKLTPAGYWMAIHPVTLLLFAATLIAHWKTTRRKFILWPLVTYVLILVATFAWFVPELMAITGTPWSENIDADLQQRGNLWINLSLVRLGVLVVTMITFTYGLSQPIAKNS